MLCLRKLYQIGTFLQKRLGTTKKFSPNKSLLKNYQKTLEITLKLQNTLSLATFKCIMEIYKSSMQYFLSCGAGLRCHVYSTHAYMED